MLSAQGLTDLGSLLPPPAANCATLRQALDVPEAVSSVRRESSHPHTLDCGGRALKFQPQVNLGSRCVFQSLKFYLGSVCDLCVWDGGVTPPNETLPIGQNKTHGARIFCGHWMANVVRDPMRRCLSEVVANVTGGHQEGEETGYMQGNCAISKHTTTLTGEGSDGSRKSWHQPCGSHWIGWNRCIYL